MKLAIHPLPQRGSMELRGSASSQRRGCERSAVSRAENPAACVAPANKNMAYPVGEVLLTLAENVDARILCNNP